MIFAILMLTILLRHPLRWRLQYLLFTNKVHIQRRQTFYHLITYLGQTMAPRKNLGLGIRYTPNPILIQF